MAEIVVATGAKIVEYSVAPIGRQFGYVIFYKSNIEKLRDAVDKLEDKRAGVMLLVDLARRNVEVIAPDVERWLSLSDEISTVAYRVLRKLERVERSCLNGWYPHLKSRFSLSRKANKLRHEVLDLLQEQNFGRISYPAPPSSFSSSTGVFIDFESRVLTIKGIMAALRDDRVYMIGICGMGVVGKTITVKEVARRMKEENLFDEVVMAVVTQQPSRKKIQNEIADQLGLKLEEETSVARAARLRGRIKDIKTVLVILDDVWETLDLVEVGIPFGIKGCKIVLTSRNQDVCSQMPTQHYFTIDILLEQEAWILFRRMASNSIDDPNLLKVAEQVAKECGGLPIALVTVGRALNNKSKYFWDDALLQLKQSMSGNIPGVQANVYQSLELSYKYLGSTEAKLLFQVCCLFPEDFDIPIEDLVRYGMGLQLFDGIDMLGEARKRVHALVEILTGCFLLSDSHKTDSVKMHDVVRDVGRSIASRDNHAFIRHNVRLEWPKIDTYEHYTSISMTSDAITELPEGLHCPKLECLLLVCKNDSLKIPNNLFDGMRALRVLDFQAMRVLVLPSSLASLKNLRTLSLRNCQLGDISVIGELEKLEFLSLYGSSINILPKEIGKLAKLRLLDLTKCTDLETISPGAISGLVRLEELHMLWSSTRCSLVEIFASNTLSTRKAE
ncbi:hypothetical protein F0562_015744 [Nyssa sinensis]|uniref:Uncharacterized protein n=1 Tax=Nyssa sinensis TaxID=561372 RepID=A0A5J4ZI11_9ASTE|nr:hypothetical protein F0562_015744 [Nyssa sinensis]